MNTQEQILNFQRTYRRRIIVLNSLAGFCILVFFLFSFGENLGLLLPKTKTSEAAWSSIIIAMSSYLLASWYLYRCPACSHRLTPSTSRYAFCPQCDLTLDPRKAQRFQRTPQPLEQFAEIEREYQRRSLKALKWAVPFRLIAGIVLTGTTIHLTLLTLGLLWPPDLFSFFLPLALIPLAVLFDAFARFTRQVRCPACEKRMGELTAQRCPTCATPLGGDEQKLEPKLGHMRKATHLSRVSFALFGLLLFWNIWNYDMMVLRYLAKADPGTTPLHWAVFPNHQESIMRLLREGADPNARDENGRTPLHWAIAHENPEPVSILLAHGADIEARSDFGDTPFLEASRNESAEIARMLARKGAFLNAQDDFGQTALLRASQKGNMEIVKILLEAGADIGVENEVGETALSEAAFEGHEEVVRVLLENKAPLASVQDCKSSPIIRAAAAGHTKVIEQLLKAGASVEGRDGCDATPLKLAAEEGQTEAVKFLLAAGARVEKSKLKKAAGKQLITTTIKNAKAGAAVSNQGAENCKPGNMVRYADASAIDIARMAGHMEIIKLLEDAGAK
ncbi:MAG: ankyrin repeat domain-containing protein [Bdellovibrionota bacterium]